MRIFEGFSTLITLLTHPLVLVGVIVVLFFGALTELIESGILPQLPQEDTAPVVHKLLDYGVIVGLAVVVLGFGFQFYKLYRGTPIVVSTPKKAAILEQRNRQRMLEKVHHFWIDGVLNQSLYHVARIELGLVEQPEAIEHPWELVVQQPEHTSRSLPDGMPMHAVFDQFDKTLLLLGAPGSGKTTLLLELARDLIERAQEDPDHPIPVVFNLSSWALRRTSIAEWLVDELNKRYDVPRVIGQHWVDNQQVLPLLDGLDEVASEHRADCVEEINVFRGQYGLLPLVVCSRVEDYEALTVRLRLPGAVTIHPLTRNQIDQYLKNTRAVLSGVIAALREDETLWELLDTPLMLSILALTYQGRMVSDIRIVGLRGGFAVRRAALFDEYIGAMFTRRHIAAHYTPEQTRHWLAWLARSMMQHGQTTLYLEQLQSDWLPVKQARLQNTIPSLFIGLLFGLLFGILFLPILSLTNGLLLEQVIRSAIWVFFVFIFGFFGVSWFGSGDDLIHPVEHLHWSWMVGFTLLLYCLFTGLIIGLFSELMDFLFLKEEHGPSPSLVGSIKAGLFFGMLIGLSGGWVADEIAVKNTPNEGIHRSLRNAMFFGLLFALCLWPFTGLFFGTLVGLIVGLKKGGQACIEHGVLRVIMWRYDYTPLNYVRFLNHAVERLFLRKAGGGYIFMHQLLMEHFAESEE